MSKSIEKVFIAWGGNQSLAKKVSVELLQYGFNGIVGGGLPTDMYIGTQIFSQMSQCTRAIILAEPRDGTSDVYSGNLLFEWGYLTAKMDPRKLHVFVVGESGKTLPSDLAGIWASEIITRDKTTDQVAKDIASIFCDVASRPIDIDKISILNRWVETKRDIVEYAKSPIYSEIELAHNILHSIEACYYNMEEIEFNSLVDKIDPVSTSLEFVIQIVKANATLFIESETLTRQLPFDTYFELMSVFNRQFDFSNQDQNLNMWLKYFCSRRLALLETFIAKSEEMDKDARELYSKKSMEYNYSALTILSDIAEKYPQEATYTKLYERYVCQDLSTMFDLSGDTEKAKDFIIRSSKAIETFYMYYKQRFPGDTFLIKLFGEEYYLSCAERLKYTDNAIERKMIESTIRSFLSKLENENGRQHVVLKQLRQVIEDEK